MAIRVRSEPTTIRPPTRARRLLSALVLTLATALGLPAVGAAPAAAATGPVMYPSGIGADLGPTPNTLGLTAGAGANAAGLQTGTLGGKTYWQTQVAAGTTFFDFAPNSGYIAGLSGKSVVVLVTYYDSGSGELTLRAADGTTVNLAALGGSNTWKRAAAQLTNTEFAAGTTPDLRLSAISGGSATDITVAQVRITAAGPSATLGPVATNDRLTPNAGDNPSGLITGTAAGRGYWQTNAASPSPGTSYLYMNVDDNYAYNTTNTVLVSVDYLDSGNGTLDLQYDSPGPTIPDMFKPSQLVHYGDTGTWQTHDFVLDDAILTDRSNGSDFRLAHDGSNVELKIAAVRVTVIPVGLDVKAGLRALISTARLAVYAAREGTRDGQYPPGSKAALSSVIAQAQQVVDDPSAGESQVATALQSLYTAYQGFLASAVDLNLAHHATLTASSSAAGSSPSAANDGDAGTVWTSGSGGSGEWLQADLGAARPVNDVLVQWGQNYSPDYTVQLSTNVSAAAAPTGGGTTALLGNETIPGAYENGSQVTAVAHAAPGYHFVNWTLAGQAVATTPAYTLTVTADTALTANFAANS